MNILLVHDLKKAGESATYGAVPYYRMQKPHEVLCRMYPEFDYFTTNTIAPDQLSQAVVDQTDIVLFTRTVYQKDIELITTWGKPWGVDVDDYWHLPNDHILHSSYEKNDIPNVIENGLRQANFVISTTELLAEKVYPINKNVHVIENGIDAKDEVWQPKKVKSNRLRFGFTQGVTHVPDIETISESVAKCMHDVKFNKSGQIVLCGFNAEFGKPSVYVGYESMLTGGLNNLKFESEYVKALRNLEWPKADDKIYKRLPMVPVDYFGKVFNELDVVVAPLKDSEFNSCKSNIKMLEAGFMDCAVMCHDVQPYSPLMTKKNSFSLTEKTFFEWQRYMLLNPEAVKERAAQLKEDVQKYELSKLTDKRKQLYEAVHN